MTDEQLDGLARLTVANSRVLGKLGGCLCTLAEQLLTVVPEQAGVIACLSELEQTQALLDGLAPVLDQASRDLGIS